MYTITEEISTGQQQRQLYSGAQMHNPDMANVNVEDDLRVEDDTHAGAQVAAPKAPPSAIDLRGPERSYHEAREEDDHEHGGHQRHSRTTTGKISALVRPPRRRLRRRTPRRLQQQGTSEERQRTPPHKPQRWKRRPSRGQPFATGPVGEWPRGRQVFFKPRPPPATSDDAGVCRCVVKQATGVEGGAYRSSAGTHGFS